MPKRVSVKGAARSALASEKKTQSAARTSDSFQNFAARLGVGTGNIQDFSTYGFNPITRIRTLLEWIHRGSWVGGVAIDLVADDMTRGGVDFGSTMEPEDVEQMNAAVTRLGFWPAINDAIKWARLYGGAIAVPLIDGQDLSKPLRDKVPLDKGQFKGILVLDRWMVEPSLQDIVTEMGPDMGLPKFYYVRSDAPGLRNTSIHYSRCLRLEGIRLPYWQRVMENMWGISVLERLYDRMIAFDSATTGAAQLVYKSWLRTMKIKKFREILAAGGPAMTAVTQQVEMTRMFQTNEGMTVIDSEDELTFDSHQAFTGLSDALLQFGQQIAGALQIPLVRLFGQSPAGLNSTGESDLRMYYDGIKKEQERWLKVPLDRFFHMIADSEGVKLPGNFTWTFNPLWQLTDKEKADVALTGTQAINVAAEGGMISQAIALKELRQIARVTGYWSNVTNEDIDSAEEELPPDMNLEDEPDDEDVGEGSPSEEEGASSKTDKDKPPKQPKAAKQKDASPYPGGLPIMIETPQYTPRAGFDNKMAAHYGYIQGKLGADGDAMDVFVGPNHESPHVWVIHQRRLSDKSFDEHKCMVGFDSERDATLAYLHSYDGDLTTTMSRIQRIDAFSMDEFKDWLALQHDRYSVARAA